ncbi:MAG: hypothetical protein WCW62_12570 [Bacteroidales bacterium]|jgi:hypothetical protein
MLEITFNTRTYPIPESWNELTPEQFINLVHLLRGYTRGELSADQVRILFFLDAAGIKPQRVLLKKQADIYSENVFRIARQLNFMFRIEYENKKSISAFPIEIQRLLYRVLPEEIDNDSAEIPAARKFRKQQVIDATFGINLIPVIKLRRKVLSGYKFNLTGNIIQFDLKAGQFIDECTVFDQFNEAADPVYLDMITGILYDQPIEVIGKIPDETKEAVLFNFQANLMFLQENTDYSVLWWNNPANTKKSPSSRLGFSDSLYTIAKAGYGDFQNLKDLPVIDFLNLLVKELRDAVLALKEAKKNNAEIAEITKLTLAHVNFLSQ